MSLPAQEPGKSADVKRDAKQQLNSIISCKLLITGTPTFQRRHMCKPALLVCLCHNYFPVYYIPMNIESDACMVVVAFLRPTASGLLQNEVEWRSLGAWPCCLSSRQKTHQRCRGANHLYYAPHHACTLHFRQNFVKALIYFAHIAILFQLIETKRV